MQGFEKEKEKERTNELWTEKYKPCNSNEIVGNEGKIKQFKDWLCSWHNSKPKKTAILLGPNGVGKTIASHLLARECGYMVLEVDPTQGLKNSDVEMILHATYCKGIEEMIGGLKKVLLIENCEKTIPLLSSFIKRVASQTLIPAIFCCNSLPLFFHSFSRQCEIFRFRKPTNSELMEYGAQILKKEERYVDTETLETLVCSSNGDMRQFVNSLQFFNITSRSCNKLDENWFYTDKYKTIEEIVPEIFHEKSQFDDRLGFYFVDDVMAPLMIQDTYPYFAEFSSDESSDEALTRLSTAADWISTAEVYYESMIANGGCRMSTVHAVMSTVAPAFCLKGGKCTTLSRKLPAQIAKAATEHKRYRLLGDITAKLVLKTMCQNKQSVLFDYLPLLSRLLVDPMVCYGVDGILPVLSVMLAYDLSRSDWDSILELGTNISGESSIRLGAAVKSKFMRALLTGRVDSTTSSTAASAYLPFG